MKLVINEDLEKYSKYLTEKKNCLVCSGKRVKVWARYGSYKAVRCEKCGFIWINPCLNAAGLDIYYNDYIGMRFEDKVKTKQRAVQYRIDADFIQNFVSSGRVLDIGCSGGFFLNTLNPKFRKYGTEVDLPAVKYARKTHSFGRNVYHCSVEDSPLQDRFFDLAVMRGVIEHIPDPRPAVKKAASLLKKNGYLFIAATPNVDSFCAGVYREKWNQFHPVRHVSYFSVRTLQDFLKKYGFKLIAKDLPYLETPYADMEKDHAEMIKACLARKNGNFSKMGRSRAFWGNMMNLVFRKVK